ncbi:hypothetical protein OAM06_02580 [Pelagibacteraceae bacterium]|nr:hypothetical protein [Pelagibacteraceae bacterium]|tara:strand:- start:2056 stop:4227 length:2172 start_codon:yes stop_codon:yes gene_type:complete
MKKIVFNFILIFIFLFVSLLIVLSSYGVETDKFNKIIIKKISQTKNINIELNTIKFKINPKELSLFLETQNPKISYRDISVPAKNIKVYIDFLSLFKSDTQIKKISLILKELDITQLKKLSAMIKPSNFKSLLNNKVKEGQVITEIVFYLTEKSTIQNFIAKGSVKNLKVELFNSLNFSDVNLEFFADKNDLLIKNIIGKLDKIEISDGDIKLNLDTGIKLTSNFNSKFNIDEKFFKKYDKLFSRYEFSKNIKNLKVNLNNNLNIDFDKTYKIKDYNYKISGNLEKAKFELARSFKNSFITEGIKQIYLSNFQISTIFAQNKIQTNGEGKYSFNNLDYLNLILENNFNKDTTNLKLNFDYKNSLDLSFINYKKTKNSLANLNLDLEKKADKIKIKNLSYQEGKNVIKINSLVFDNNFVSYFKKIDVKTTDNDFSIQNNNKIIIKGNKFDASNLAKFFTDSGEKNIFNKINESIEISFKNIKVPLSDELQNFNLIGNIEKGKFTKISSKGDFGANNFLDISMKKNKNSDKKYLEIYSDLAQPLLTEYSFFKGLVGGKLFFTSEIDGSKSNSVLTIENFKVSNAPDLVKLLSLADLSGLADLAEGEGLSFDILEIDMEKNQRFLKLNEILALGPSISVLMEGYQDEEGLTSLRGTLVPAKTLNKMISKIPVIGKIVIPKEVGEGLFGISFKIKGPKGKIKTTINPIRTLTPRFIQKILDKNKNIK